MLIDFENLYNKLLLTPKLSIMSNKVYMQLSEEDLELLNSLIKENPSQSLFESFRKTTDRLDEDGYIRYHTFLALSYMSGYNINSFNENSDLRFDLGLTFYQKRALTNAFQDIVKAVHYTKNIFPSECEKLTTVGSCIILIKSKK
ncbi:hypothetical protein QF024_002139 [Chryseobacterium nepalense]|nr:hypothetical protein [Chryseobacterium nepalense]